VKTLLSKLSDQLAPSDAPDAARGRARKAEAPGGAFRDLLGRALARSTGATHDLGRNKLHHVHTARAGAAKGVSERAIGENGAGAAEGAAFEEQGEQGQFEGTATSSRTGGSRSPRVPARKRREADGKDPVESANGSSPAGHIAAPPTGHAAPTVHAVSAAPPRSEKAALTGDGVARLASTLATRQPLATPSPAPASASSRERSREREKSRAEEPAPAAEAGEGLYLRVQAFQSREPAEALAAELDRLGYRVSMVTKSRVLWKSYEVRVGPFRNEEAALAARRRLEAEGFKDIRPVREGE